MIYMSNILKYTRRDDLEDPRLETIWVEITLKAQNILICCFYHRDFNISQSLFLSELQNCIETALDYTPFVKLTGDINIDFINFTNIQLRDCLSLFNLTNVIINEPTRIAENSSTLIDPVLVSDACTVLDSGTLTIDNTISDHKATYVSI